MKKESFSKIFIAMLLTLALSLSGISKEKTVDSHWISSPVKVDGSDTDWTGTAYNSEKKVGVDYSFKNDAEYLYVLFKFKDPQYLSSINATGLTLWFNTEGKKKKHFGIKFSKKKVSADEYISLIEQKRGAMSEEEKNALRLNPFYFIADIKVINKKQKSFSGAAASKKPAKYNVITKENIVTYEFAVPLKEATDQASGVGAKPGESIKIGFEWGGLTDEIREAWIKSRASGSRTQVAPPSKIQSESGRGGGSTGSSALSSRAPGSLKALRMMTKTYSFWVDVRLATSQKNISMPRCEYNFISL